MTNTLPWSIRLLHRSSEVQIVDARGRLVGFIESREDADRIVAAVNAAAPADHRE
jgi:hypothetical protein